MLSISQNVRMFVCVFVCVFVRHTFSLHLMVFLPPLPLIDFFYANLIMHKRDRITIKCNSNYCGISFVFPLTDLHPPLQRRYLTPHMCWGHKKPNDLDNESGSGLSDNIQQIFPKKEYIYTN